ncbi:MAG TPA: hypothetical protein VJ302_10205 [Blastocatellia bacterium]|nr:hypothetical protein [Blastocatellia bacterium]
MEALSNIKRRPSPVFTSDFSALGSERILTESLYPTGFIFHGGRSGSTLLIKALARSRANLVLGEAAPFAGILSILTNFWQRTVGADPRDSLFFKHLVLAMGRRRLTAHRAYLIKFTSFNLFFYDFITGVFPDVPALFLYREPQAMLSSMLDNPPGWLNSLDPKLRALITGVTAGENQAIEPLLYAERALAKIFSAALQAGARGLRFLNYHQLTANNLPVILQALNIAASPEELRLMSTQFDYYSKDDYGAQLFHPDSRIERRGAKSDRRTGAARELEGLYKELARSTSNLFTA